MADAKIVAVIDDMSRHEIIDLLVGICAIFRATERTVTLRRYIKGEYVAGRIKSSEILSAYQGGL